MNGEPLPQMHGFPVRLIAPGWYGIANVKWLQRIEVLPTRYENRFMARDYVTIREQQVDGQTVWTETSVGRALLKSAPAKVTRDWRPVSDRGRRLGCADRPGGGPDRRWAVAAGHHRRGRRTPSSPGSCGRWSGRTRPRASTPSPLEQLTSRGTSSRRRTTRGSPASTPTGRATDRSRAVSASPDCKAGGVSKCRSSDSESQFIVSPTVRASGA